MQEENKLGSAPDVQSHNKKYEWFYTDTVKDHFFHPRNFMDGEPADYNGMGMVGSPACGDMMTLWIKVDPESERVKECRWKTFGCASAISSTSIMSVMVSEGAGMPVEDALKLRPQDIIARLGGLPQRKFHCSVLGDKALRAAINDYFRRSGQGARAVVEGTRVVDKILKITDRDIEEAVLDGADTLEKVQAKTKVGTGDPSCLPEAEQLIRFYKEKYFG